MHLCYPLITAAITTDGRVEALGRVELGDADPEVVDAAVGRGARALVAHGLDSAGVG
jgi:hypothetical protein